MKPVIVPLPALSSSSPFGWRMLRSASSTSARMCGYTASSCVRSALLIVPTDSAPCTSASVQARSM